MHETSPLICSDVFNRDLFKVLLPVFLEALLFFPFRVKLGHHVVQALLEALLEVVIVLVASANNRFVVVRILDFHLASDLVLDLVATLDSLRRGRWAAWYRHCRSGTATNAFSRCIYVAVSCELLLKINLKDGWA